MPYTNGYNITKVLPALSGRLAWSDSTLNTANTTSKSGRKFDDGSFHALVTVENIKLLAAAANTDWNAYLTGKQNAVISRCLNSVFDEPEFKEQVRLYDRENESECSYANTGQAIGYRIDVVKQFDISVLITSLELYFDGVATFNVYLYKQGSLNPLQTKSVTTVANEKTTIDLTDWLLNSKEAATYFVVYFQADLGSVKAIQEQACWNKTLFFSACPFTAATTGTVFKRNQLSYPSQPVGLNLQVSSFRDFTQNILNQPHLFDNLLGMMMAYQVIEEFLYSIRSNTSERQVKEQIDRFGLAFDLNGAAPVPDSPKIVGLKQRIEKETLRVRQAFYPKVRAQIVNLAPC